MKDTVYCSREGEERAFSFFFFLFYLLFVLSEDPFSVMVPFTHLFDRSFVT